MKLVLSLTLSVVYLGNLATVLAVDFDSEVFPILKTHCAKCHMDGESKGKLSLDRNVIAKQLGPYGSIVAGNVKRSDLHWTMTLDPDDDSAMPPKGKRVPPADIDLIAKWIEEGAVIGDASSKPAATAASSGGSEPKDPAPAAIAEKPPELKPYKGVFKNHEGMQVSATLVRMDGDRAILILPDGKEYRYPVEMFAQESKELVEKFKAGNL